MGIPFPAGIGFCSHNQNLEMETEKEWEPLQLSKMGLTRSVLLVLVQHMGCSIFAPVEISVLFSTPHRERYDD